jgi:hypothetical protein
METQFLTFVELFGVSLNTTNLQIYKDLYEHFNTFQTIDPGSSFEKRFILWKNHCDQQSSLAKNQQPTAEMIPNNNHLPYKLQKIANEAAHTSSFNNFSLKTTSSPKNTSIETATESHHITYDMAEQVLEEFVVVVNEDTLQTTAGLNLLGDAASDLPEIGEPIVVAEPIVVDQPVPIPQHRGKNIEVLKACYNESQIKTESVAENETCETFTNKRKRKRTTRPVIGSGRPTNDNALMKLANEHEVDDTLSCRQLLLLSSTQEIRKKTTIYTKHPADLRCFAIKHYSSFCHIAEQRKEALETIKKQRMLLEQLAYIETSLLPLIRDNNNNTL